MAVTALIVWPKRRRLGLHFDIYDHPIRTEEIAGLIRWRCRRFPKGIVLVMDRPLGHRSWAKRAAARFGLCD
ncbi:MAG: hypothetical protein IH988_02145 [Planctomycetes bacterium]|nr:hypothetical protein [Planctomycetota bacterium]